jgi:F-type H+-transporting ATPase subunit b
MPRFVTPRLRRLRRALSQRPEGMRAHAQVLGGAPLVLLSGGSGGSPVDLDGSLLIQLGIFCVAFFILRSLVFKPVMNLFDEREAAMEGSRKQAEAMERDAAEKREKFEGELRSVRQKANEDRDRQRSEAQKLARELTEKARRENTATLSSAKAQLDGEAKDARVKALADAPALARQIAEKLLGRSVN